MNYFKGTSTISPFGNAYTVASGTLYHISGVDCFITSTDSSNTNNSIVIKDKGGNTLVTYSHTCTSVFVPIGYSVTFTFTGTAPTVTVFGN
jgi:hypothetical protein